MPHSAVPQSMTPEQLAQWILANALGDPIVHETKIPLEEETIHELENASASASRSIMRLEEKKKEFMEFLKEGTPTSVPENSTDEPKHQPIDITIPPTKGLKALKKNLEFANKQLEDGFKIENTEVYMIPQPETSMVIGVTITGEEFVYDEDRVYTRSMSDDEVNNIKPLLKEAVKPKKEKKEKKSFMDEAPVDEDTINI